VRIDLTKSPTRPWFMRFMVWAISKRAGFTPGPLVVLTYRPKLFSPLVRRYLARGMSSLPPWTRGERELIGAYVSDVNTCHF